MKDTSLYNLKPYGYIFGHTRGIASIPVIDSLVSIIVMMLIEVCVVLVVAIHFSSLERIIIGSIEIRK